MDILLSILLFFSVQARANVQLTPKISVPKVNLNFWNNTTSVQWNNNCYNYSTNRVTNTFAQPGEASSEMYDDLTCESVELAASKDLGLTLVKHFDFKNKDEETLIALVVAPGYDFHWYRRDDNKMWSHKPGATPATTLDQSDDPISNPETADRGYYTDFCGYFKISNHLHDAGEQDAGYVRIGDMLDLPDYTNSSENAVETGSEVSDIEILIYSGRKNPRVPLEAFMTMNGLAKPTLEELSQRLEVAPIGVMSNEFPSRLGYSGILIRDNKGLLFPKGTSVHVIGDTIVAYSKGRQVVMYSAVLSSLEESLKSYIPVVGK